MLIAIEAIWEYQSHSDTVPVDPTTVTVPSSGWTSGGVAPFGELSTLAVPYPINTDWASNSGLWVRRNVVTDGLAGLLVSGQIENTCFVYFDGAFVGFVNPSNADVADAQPWNVVIPVNLVTAGTHQIAVKCFDETGGADGNTYFYLTADYVQPMIPYQPAAPASENLEWMTEVQISNDATEEAEQLRLGPRQSFKFAYPATALQQPGALNLVWGGRHKSWLVPVWPQGQLLGAVAAGSAVLHGVQPAEYRDASLALLWESPESWQLIGSNALSGTDLPLNSYTQEFTNAWLMPVRSALLITDPQRALNGYDSQFLLEFRVTDNAALAVDEPDQYIDNDIYTDASLVGDDRLTDIFTGNFDIQDEALGQFVAFANWANSRTARTRSIVAEDLAEAWALRLWLHRRAGKYVRFWEPSFESDLRVLNTATITTTINISADQYLKWAGARTHIAVETKAGWLFRAITDATVVSASVTQLTIDTALSIAPKDILRVCWLGLKRLDSDSVDISWVGNGVCQTDMRVLEVKP